MKKFLTFIATTALVFATNGEVCEKNGGIWAWHGDVNQWKCDNLQLNEQSIKRLAQYEKDYLAEFENLKKTLPQRKFKFIQPRNKKEACRIAVPEGDNDPTKDSSYKIFWDGECKDGYAFGLGREIEKANLKDAWQIGIYEKGMVKGCFVQKDLLKMYLSEGEGNYYGSAHTVRRFVNDTNRDIDISYAVGKAGNDFEPDIAVVTSPFSNNTVEYHKRYPNFEFLYVDFQNNNMEQIDFNFQLLNDKGVRHGWGFEKNKNGPLVKGEYVHGEAQPSELPQEYMQKADGIVKEIDEAKNKAIEAQGNALLVKKQYLKKICRDSVKVTFMDNSEYKDICVEKDELELQAKIDKKLANLEKEKAASLQKQQQEQFQQKQNEQMRQQQTYQQQQLNIQRQQQQKAERAAQEQLDAIDSLQHKYNFDRQQDKFYQNLRKMGY